MLRSQYGLATSSSPTPLSHAEDAQPNETIYKRRHGLPPQIGSTESNYQGSVIQRGSRGGPWTQHAIRGNRSWRGRGNLQSNYNSNQRHTQLTHQVSVPPIATLDIETSSSSNSSSSSQINQPSMPVIQSSQTEPHYKAPPDRHVPPFSAYRPSESRPVDDYHWLRRSRSPSPKLPPLALKRRKIERPNSERNEELTISQSIKHQSLTGEPAPSRTDKPLLPGRHRRFEGSAPIPALHSQESPAKVNTAAVSPITSNTLAGTSSIKQETYSPSPTRSPRMERSLISTSCKFYPIPEFCKKSHPGFAERRKTFFIEKMQELSRLGLKRVRSFFREDGLVIEWESKVPVWSDTLLPEFSDLASAIKRAHEINHRVSPSPKRKRQSIDRQSRESSLKNNTNVKASGLNESKRPRHPLENTPIYHRTTDIEMAESRTVPLRISSSPTPTSSLDHGNHRSTPVIPLLDTSELICFDPETETHNPDEDLELPNTTTSVIQQQKTPAMDGDTPTPTQSPKPMQQMLFKPVHPLRKNQITTSVQDSTLLTSDSVEPLSTSAERDSKSQVNSLQNEVPQEKMNLPRPRPPLPTPRRRHSPHGPAQTHTLPIQRPLPVATQKASNQSASKSRSPILPPPPGDAEVTEETEVTEVEVQERRAPSKDETIDNTTESDAELVVNLLLHGTPEESNNHLSNSHREQIMEDLHPSGYEDEEYAENKDDEASASTEEDTAAVDCLAIQFLHRYLQLFDVDRLKLEAAYAKNALFSCRVLHVQEPSLSTAVLFIPESNESRQGSNVSRSRAPIKKGRAQIVNRLLELGPHRFCPRGVPRSVNYDVVPLSSATGGGILLTAHGEVVNPHLAGPQLDHVLLVDQSFVLRKRAMEDENENEGKDGFGQVISSAAASNLWPVVVVSHQMTVRDVAQLPSEQLDAFVPPFRGSL